MQKTLVASLLLSLINISNAAVQVYVNYDSISDTTTLDYTGSLDVSGRTFGNNGIDLVDVNESGMTASDSRGRAWLEPGGFAPIDFGGFYFSASGGTFSWGDNFGFTSGTFRTNQDYVSFESIVGSIQFDGDIASLSLGDPEEYYGGTYGSGFNSVTWTTAPSQVEAPVPEPSTYALLLGLCALGLTITRRRAKSE